ncbi:Uncharacterised protein [Candidatus Tiddalikarchaeum anstoanum]|nr:Uncharacterised protein [Candidatus Tiddalikarchaeum anstoanum]
MEKQNDNSRNTSRKFNDHDRTRKFENSERPVYKDPVITNKINGIREGEYFNGVAKILRKVKPGPVIFTLSDGLSTIDGVIKDSEYDVDNVVDIKGLVTERAGKLQIEIEYITKSSTDFNKIIEELSKPVRTTFSIKSERYEKMKTRFMDIAKRIRRAIIDNEPIIIRHHNDSDGINAGIAIELACQKMMEKIGINPSYNLYRSPSMAPFYETSDVFRDLTLSKRLTEEHDQKKPLILVLDSGSTPEDIFSFKIMKTMNHECIVVDHHNPVIIEKGKTTVCDYLSYHLNPYLFGFDNQTSAGMLCYELARMINEEFENPSMPAVAAISDRCTIRETDDYVKNSKKSLDELKKVGIAIDFIAYNLRFESGEGVFEELYTNYPLVELINEEVRKDVEKQLQSTMPYLRTQEIDGITFSHIDLEKYTLRFTYPTPGKVLGMIHDTIALGKEHSPVITIGYVSDMIIIRATQPVLPVQKLIKVLREKIPEANVDGGGHEMAGTIKFVPAHLTRIIEIIKEELKNVKYAETLHGQ